MLELDSCLNEELGRHRGRNSRTERSLCGDNVRVLSMFCWSVLLTKIRGKGGMVKLRINRIRRGLDFEALDNTEKASFVLGCELWTENFDALLALVKEYIINLWEVRKVKLYGEPCSTQLQSQSLAGDPRDGTVEKW